MQKFVWAASESPVISSIMNDRVVVIISIIVVGAIIIVGMLAFARVSRAAFAPDASTLSEAEAQNILRIATLCAILACIVMLGILNLLNQSLLTFLGTISGVVIGGVAAKK